MKHALIDLPVQPDDLERFAVPASVTVRVSEGYREEPRELPEELLRTANYCLCMYPPVNLSAMVGLEMIQVASAGYNQLMGLGLIERGVRACNGAGNFDVPIAEWCVAMIVALARDLRSMIRHQESGVWDRDRRFQTEVRGKTLGIWGYGGIGRETARLGKAMGMRVHAMTRDGAKRREHSYRLPGTGDPDATLPDRVFTEPDRTAFLRELDFLVLTMPLTKATEGIVGEAELAALRRTAHLLNPSRGPLVQEQALLRALREGWIAGAALDTHYRYPLPPEHPLWRFPNVILTPHISGSGESPFFLERAVDMFVQNLERMTAGRPLLNELTAEQLR